MIDIAVFVSNAGDVMWLKSQQLCRQPSAMAMGGGTIGIDTLDPGVGCFGKPKYSPVTISTAAWSSLIIYVHG
jgi:hypothetical protein